MAIVPEGKTIYIGKRKYKAGEQLPVSYKLPEKKPAKDFNLSGSKGKSDK